MDGETRRGGDTEIRIKNPRVTASCHPGVTLYHVTEETARKDLKDKMVN